MASPHFDVRDGDYERMKQRQAQLTAAANQRRALQNMKNFHYRDRDLMNSYIPPQPKVNAIGIPLIRQSGQYYG